MKSLQYYAQALLFLYVVIAAGCVAFQPADVPESPRQAIAYGYVTVDSLADGLRIAKRDGHITAEKRDEIAEQLQSAFDDLVMAQNALMLFEETGDIEYEQQVNNRLAQAHALLSIIESLLSEVKYE